MIDCYYHTALSRVTLQCFVNYRNVTSEWMVILHVQLNDCGFQFFVYCLDGIGTMRYNNDDEYRGTWYDGIKHGLVSCCFCL